MPIARNLNVFGKEVSVMNEPVLRSWWIFALRGVIAILFAVMALMWPGLTLLALTGLFAAYALLSGIVLIAGAVKLRKTDDHWGLLLLLGLVGIAAAALTFMHPALTALLLVLVIGANALVTGVLDIALAIRLRRIVHDEWMMLINGIAAVVFGILVFLFPAAGALALVWLISLYAVVTGVLLLGLAFRLRARAKARTGVAERRVVPDRRMTGAH